MSRISAAAFSDTKPHYDLLDGLRGVAALTVVCFHLFEAYATSHLDQRINHGYLAVDFFFILSGFVVGYAYDDRWTKMTVREFLTRRLVRLQPMVVIGALIGAVMFYTQGCPVWDVSAVPVAMLLVATLMNAFMIPATPGAEIRGVGEMYPLNGPAWSLFFEYIGNVLYALFIRRLSTRALAVLVAAAGCGLAAFSVWGPLGDICVGFSLTGENIVGGSLRLLFAFPAGLLLSREHLWMNGVYDALCAVVLFPLIVWIGASGKTTDRVTSRICKFLGDISYPLYMVHYPFIYLYYAWVKNENLTFGQSLPGAAALVAGSVALAWLCLRFYDEPVRLLRR